MIQLLCKKKKEGGSFSLSLALPLSISLPSLDSHYQQWSMSLIFPRLISQLHSFSTQLPLAMCSCFSRLIRVFYATYMAYVASELEALFTPPSSSGPDTKLWNGSNTFDSGLDPSISTIRCALNEQEGPQQRQQQNNFGPRILPSFSNQELLGFGFSITTSLFPSMNLISAPIART